MTGLEHSHVELRAAIVFAARRIAKLSLGQKDDPSLEILSNVLRKARVVFKERKAQVDKGSQN